jgi:hypothetical protein
MGLWLGINNQAISKLQPARTEILSICFLTSKSWTWNLHEAEEGADVGGPSQPALCDNIPSKIEFLNIHAKIWDYSEIAEAAVRLSAGGDDVLGFLRVLIPFGISHNNHRLRLFRHPRLCTSASGHVKISKPQPYLNLLNARILLRCDWSTSVCSVCMHASLVRS